MKDKGYIQKEVLNTKQKMEISVKRYKSSFYKRFGIKPIVIYEDLHDIKLQALFKRRNCNISLDDLERIVNSFVDKSLFPNGISTRSRKKDLVILRQLYMYFGYKFDFSVVNVSRKIGFHHAMVIHSVKMIGNIIDTNDRVYLRYYKEVKNEIEKQTGSTDFL